MPQKDIKARSDTNPSSMYGESELLITPRLVSLTLVLEGNPPGPGDWPFLAFFNGQIVLEGKWCDELVLESESLALNLIDIYYQQLIASFPLILMLRTVGGKGAKDPDPLLNADNRAGATVDLFPLYLGEEEVNVQVPLVMITTGERTDCIVSCYAKSIGASEIDKIPLMITMVSAHCLPPAKDGTVYIAALGLNGLLDNPAVNFGMSLSTADARKVVWATVSNGGQAANTVLNVPNEDKFIPQGFEVKNSTDCISVYWNAMNRVLVDPMLLRDRLLAPFLVEIAGIPRAGKTDVRGRYMALVEGGVLLQPSQFGVTTCAKLLFFSEADLPENIGPLLDLPPTSAKASARETDLIMDELGHNAYIVIRFDLMEPLVPKTKIAWFYDSLGYLPPEGPSFPIESLEIEPPPEDPAVDVRRIRKECGALAVHKELSGLACRGAVPMNQGIKRTAANRLLMRVRTMLKQFPPGECSFIDWQDIVTAQHAASRRAVTASFAPQPPPLRPTSRVAAARCRIAGDTRLANMHVENNVAIMGNHPRAMLTKVLRLLEEGKKQEARNNLQQVLSVQTRSKYLLWTFGAQEFNSGIKGLDDATTAFLIAVNGNTSEGTSNAIGWAALHTLYHYSENYSAAFVAAKKMRQSYELPREWKAFYKRWTDLSGEEEIYWNPSTINFDDPMLVAAAFFLCLRCYAFAEKLLKCYEGKCSIRGSRLKLEIKIGCDLYYIKAATYLLKQELDKALNVTNECIARFGPSAMMSEMRATCLARVGGWDGECEQALLESDHAGAETSPLLLLKAALSGMNLNPFVALQRAARAHKIAKSPHSALVIGRIYKMVGEEILAERWASVAVMLEPMLADGWAFLAILAMMQRDVNRARTMLRTAKQVGPLSEDIAEEVQKLKDIVQVEALPEALVKDLCLCDYY